MEIRRYIFNELKNIGIKDSELSAETTFILQNFLNITNPYMDFDISIKDKEELTKIFQKRKNGEPLQYILGVADFMGEKFIVNESVLIPRPETEILVKQVIEKSKKFSALKILDIGSGSGCIAIMLSKLINNATVFSCDISENALKVAKQNAQKLNASVNFIHSDVFKNINEKFDIIVSNPPYIPKSEEQNLQKEIQFEPKLALFANDKFGIEFYNKIISNGKNYLNKNGFILFELGINQSELVKKLFIDYNYSKIEIIKDLDNIERVISAKVQNG